MKKPWATGLLSIVQAVVLVMLLIPKDAQAIPAFARKHQMTCSGCHTAWPMLNETGRAFKENGYQYSRGETGELEKISDHLQFDKSFPISGILVARPFDKKDSGDEKIRALHEVEVMVAGQMFKDVSGFFELEAEDETGFMIEVPQITVGFHPYDEFNVQFAWAPYTWSDPYDTYSDARRLTRGHASVLDQTFGGVDGKLRKPRQGINLFGRVSEKLFYSASISGVVQDPEGENPNNILGRVAVDVSPTAMVGFLGIKGKNEAANLDYSRVGVDCQADIGDARIMGAFLRGKDDFDTIVEGEPAIADETNNVWYVQGLYVVRQGDRPTWVPLVRIDSYEKHDGADDYTDITLNLGHYFAENLKGYIEFWKQVSAPDGVEKDNRITIQFVASL